MPERHAAIDRFLAGLGWTWAERTLLAGDASFRTYWRLARNERRAVLMDAPPPMEDVRPFLRIDGLLRGLGLSAPAILGADEEAGLLLLEDLGDDTYTRLLSAGSDPAHLYGLAVDVLIHLHRQFARAGADGVPDYDEDLLLAEVNLLVDWYLPAVTPRPLEPAARNGYAAAWRQVLAPVLAEPKTLVLRDFHVDNLPHFPARPGAAACGLLDFQDAVLGPAAYDLMSLLEDARRDVDAALKATMLARYRSAFPAIDWPRFLTVFAVLAAQRHAKVIGIFTRLCYRDGKSAYLKHIPRVWRLLEGALGDAALGPLTRWFEEHLPRSLHTIPPLPEAAQ